MIKSMAGKMVGVVDFTPLVDVVKVWLYNKHTLIYGFIGIVLLVLHTMSNSPIFEIIIINMVVAVVMLESSGSWEYNKGETSFMLSINDSQMMARMVYGLTVSGIATIGIVIGLI